MAINRKQFIGGAAASLLALPSLVSCAESSSDTTAGSPAGPATAAIPLTSAAANNEATTTATTATKPSRPLDGTWRGLQAATRVIAGDYTDQGGANAALQMLADDELPTAVVTANDWSAIGLLTTLLRHGVRVPEDVSVVGYDDSLFARRTYLDLTSVAQDTAKLADAAITAAARRLDGLLDPPTETVIEPLLVVRSSTTLPRPVSSVGTSSPTE